MSQFLFDQAACEACSRFSEMMNQTFPNTQNDQPVETVQENNPPQPTLADFLARTDVD